MSRAHSLMISVRSHLSLRRELMSIDEMLTEQSEVNIVDVPADSSMFLRLDHSGCARVSKAHSLHSLVRSHLSLRRELSRTNYNILE